MRTYGVHVVCSTRNAEMVMFFLDQEMLMLIRTISTRGIIEHDNKGFDEWGIMEDCTKAAQLGRHSVDQINKERNMQPM